MLKVVKSSERICVETGAAILEWSISKGGQIVRCDLKGSDQIHTMLCDDEAVPNLTLDMGERTISQAQRPVEVSFGREDDQCFAFSTKSKMADGLAIEQHFEVFREGVVFCELSLILESDCTVTIHNAQMSFGLEVVSAKNLRTSYISRDPLLKQDVTCIHVLSESEVCVERDIGLDVDQLVPVYGLDLGWQESRYFSNRLEMIIEDDTSIGQGMMGTTRTIAGQSDGKWQLTWKLCEDCSQSISGPFLYRNKWALLCGSARTQAGNDAEPARRNNVLGGRVCHVMYPYVRPGNEWPEISVPTRQVFYQDAQYAKENPSLERIDEAAALGANILILHQFWMENGGSNGEPAADYKPHDPKWLKAFIGKAHEKGMRVGVYMRGVEHYSLYMDFFEKYLKKDWDGLYIDWATPFGQGFAKTTSKHCSAYNWFMFSRALRRRVGENGFMIGHTNVQTYMSYAVFDAGLSGEFSVMHSGLLATPEVSTSYSMLGGCGVHLIAGNAPDRKMFSSQRCAGLSAGLGYSNHPFMEPGKAFAECNAFVQPLWDLWRRLPSDPNRVFNPAVGNGLGLTWSDENLHPIVYQSADKSSLVIISNLSDSPVDGWVDVDLAKLGLNGSAKLEPLSVKGTHGLTVEGSRIIVEKMPAYFFGGLLIRQSK